MTNKNQSLAAAIAEAGSAVNLLRNTQVRPSPFPATPEFTNWRSEQQAWRKTCVLFDQSHHMIDLFVEGPNALELFRDLGVNSFENFPVGKAKQFVAVNPDGDLIGDAILFHLDEDSFDLVGHEVLDWVQYNAEKGQHDVTITRDENSATRLDCPPKLFRYELQGPTAVNIVEALTGQPVPDVKFFDLAWLDVAGLKVRALRHGMAGQPGFELFGPWEQGERVLEAILKAGEQFDLVRAGAMAYSTANLESGWVPSPVPAIFSGEALADYRAWLPAKSAGSLGGSFNSDDIADYYTTPAELGYDRHVKFDHDFVGRDALERRQGEQGRRKVTLVWNPDDVAAAFRSLFTEGPKAKYIPLPKARYALYTVDTVLANGEAIGVSLDAGYISNESAFVSLATIDEAHTETGTDVSLIWGEEPNSTKPAIEPHTTMEIRAMVAPAPYESFARTGYRAAGGRQLSSTTS